MKKILSLVLCLCMMLTALPLLRTVLDMLLELME